MLLIKYWHLIISDRRNQKYDHRFECKEIIRNSVKLDWDGMCAEPHFMIAKNFVDCIFVPFFHTNCWTKWGYERVWWMLHHILCRKRTLRFCCHAWNSCEAVLWHKEEEDIRFTEFSIMFQQLSLSLWAIHTRGSFFFFWRGIFALHKNCLSKISDMRDLMYSLSLFDE